jgi:Uma2 family endonuclease
MTNPNPITEVLDPVYLPELPPTQDELPYDDSEPMESWRHRCQMDLLISTTQTWLQPRSDGFVGGNMFLYYSLEQARSRNFKGPDYFVVLSVPYVPIQPDTEGRLKSEVLGLYLVKWQGSFRDIQTKWIR